MLMLLGCLSKTVRQRHTGKSPMNVVSPLTSSKETSIGNVSSKRLVLIGNRSSLITPTASSTSVNMSPSGLCHMFDPYGCGVVFGGAGAGVAGAAGAGVAAAAGAAGNAGLAAADGLARRSSNVRLASSAKRSRGKVSLAKLIFTSPNNSAFKSESD
jgi:hypothetical protein